MSPVSMSALLTVEHLLGIGVAGLPSRRRRAAGSLSTALGVLGPQQVREARLGPQPVLDRHDRLGLVGEPVATVDDLVERPEAGCRPRRSRTAAESRGSWPQPSGQSVSTFRNAGPSAAAARSTFSLRSCQCEAAACADVRDVVRDRDRRHVLALLRLAEARRGPPGSSSSRRRTGSRPSAGCPCSCRPRCRSRRTGSGGRARARPRAPGGRCRRCRRRRRRRRRRRPRPAGSACRRRSARWALSTPLATAAAFSNATCSHGTFQAVVGKRVVATSRQPVAFTTTTGVVKVFSTVRTTSGIAAALAERVAAGERRHAGLVADERLQAGHGSPRSPT